MPTAQIFVKNIHGKNIICRAMLDSGADTCFISEGCVSRLGLKRKRLESTINGVNGSIVGHVKGIVNLSMKSRTTNYEFSGAAMIINKVAGNLPKYLCDPSKWEHIKQISLADPNFNAPGEIDILLSSKILSNIWLEKKESGEKGQPNAFKTELGWILMGESDGKVEEPHVYHASMSPGEWKEFLDTDLEDRVYDSEKPRELDKEIMESRTGLGMASRKVGFDGVTKEAHQESSVSIAVPGHRDKKLLEAGESKSDAESSLKWSFNSYLNSSEVLCHFVTVGGQSIESEILDVSLNNQVIVKEDAQPKVKCNSELACDLKIRSSQDNVERSEGSSHRSLICKLISSGCDYFYGLVNDCPVTE